MYSNLYLFKLLQRPVHQNERPVKNISRGGGVEEYLTVTMGTMGSRILLIYYLM